MVNLPFSLGPFGGEIQPFEIAPKRSSLWGPPIGRRSPNEIDWEVFSFPSTRVDGVNCILCALYC